MIYELSGIKSIIRRGNNYNLNERGLFLKSKNSHVNLGICCKSVILTFKKVSGNGNIIISLNGDVSKHIISNITEITLNDVNNLDICRLQDSFGDICLLKVETLGEMAIVKNNEKLYVNTLSLKSLSPNPNTNIDNFIKNLEVGVVKIPAAYGSKQDIINEVKILLNSFNDLFLKIKSEKSDYDLFVLDHAGIGDTIHSRLVVQNIKNKKILWILPKLYTTLYKDDHLVDVYPGVYVRFRNPWCKFCKALVTVIQKMFTGYFGNKTLNVPYSITVYLAKKPFTSFDDVWFKGCGLKRDYSVKFSLEHNGNLNDLDFDLEYNKYFVIEHASLSFGKIDMSYYEKFASAVKRYGYKCVYIGGKDDPAIKGALDGRGLSLYDTFTLIKNCYGFLGRVSGNQCMVLFDNRIPVFEIGLDKKYFTLCKDYIADERVFSYSEKEFTKNIIKYIKEQNG